MNMYHENADNLG